MTEGKYICMKCNRELVEENVNLHYMGFQMANNFLRCPVCKQVLIPRTWPAARCRRSKPCWRISDPAFTEREGVGYMVQDRILELCARGLCCSQVLMQVVGLDPLERQNPELIMAMGALGYGIRRQLTCGALSGAACALALHAKDKEQLREVCTQLVDWFREAYGGTECGDILGKGCPPTLKCREIMENTAIKSLEILEDMETGEK